MTGQAGGSRERSQSAGAKSGGSQAGDLRALKALVVGLGVLVVLGTAVVIGVIIYRIYAHVAGKPAQAGSAAHGQVARAVSAAPFERTIAGGKGGSIAGLAAAGGGIAIWVRNDAGGKVVVIDPTTGRTLGQVTLDRPAGGT